MVTLIYPIARGCQCGCECLVGVRLRCTATDVCRVVCIARRFKRCCSAGIVWVLICIASLPLAGLEDVCRNRATLPCGRSYYKSVTGICNLGSTVTTPSLIIHRGLARVERRGARCHTVIFRDEDLNTGGLARCVILVPRTGRIGTVRSCMIVIRLHADGDSASTFACIECRGRPRK